VTHDDGGTVERRASGPERGSRTPDERRTDHAAIDRLADELLPALVAKLGASGLGELDVREGGWRIRLRMPGDGRGARRAGAGGARAAARDGHGGPAHPGHAGAAGGAHAGTPAGAPPEVAAADPADDPGRANRAVALSPAVGFFRPRADLATGSRVRSGDRLGTVDVLGVAQEVVAPVDGIVGATLVAAGEPVEYGQEVVEVELLEARAAERAEGA
jgi:biotin carboxyl carrier protein